MIGCILRKLFKSLKMNVRSFQTSNVVVFALAVYDHSKSFKARLVANHS